MTLRRKTLLLIGLVLIALLIVISLTSHLILLRSFAALEAQQVARDVMRVTDALMARLEALDNVAGDWSNWDDTYRFVEDANQDYVDSNTQNTSFRLIDANVLAVVHISGRVVIAKAVDLQTMEEMPFPQGLIEHLTPGDVLLDHPDLDSRKVGVMVLPEGILLVAARPILTSLSEGPIRGTLLFGRYLDEIEIIKLAQTTHLSVTIRQWEDASLPADFETARAKISVDSPIFVQALSSQIVAGYTIVKDLYGDPALIIRVDTPRQIYQQGRNTLIYIMLSLFVIASVVSVSILILLEKVVLSRLVRLSADVSSINTSADLTARVRVDGADELSILGASINRMLETIARSEEELRRANEELEARVQERTRALSQANEQLQKEIAERQRAEDEVRKQAEDLQRKNQDLQQFAYIASHDLQEPLRMVAGYTQLLARRYKGKLDADADEFIAFAVDGATRMQQLINDLLTYSRVGTAGKPLQPIPCQEVLEAVKRNLKVSIEESGAKITCGDLPVVMADRTQMVQLFQNIIGNAIKFRGEQPLRIHIASRKENGYHVLSISDNGIGFDPQYSERIFTIFQRLHTREEYPGTGIGLAVCRRIVERHGGRIWAESKPGCGSTFFFTLPDGEGIG